MTPPRGGARRLSWPGPELSERDWAVLDDLARVRLLTGRHVERLHLRDGSPLTQARRTRSLLQRLNDMGLVVRLERRIGGLHAGSAGFVYGLAPLGQRLTTERGPAGGRRLRRPWEPSRYFVDHILAVSELYVQLRELERAGRFELLRFDAEPACWRTWTGLSGERLVLKPDAYLMIATRDFEYASFVEVNRSTESLNVIRRKAQTYVTYYQSGAEQHAHGVFPRVVWLPDIEQRREHLVDGLARLDAEHWRLFSVGLLADAERLLTSNEDAAGAA
jgi:hypothetical protein